MAFNILPDADYLRQCLDYDPATGIAIWKRRPLSHFEIISLGRRWNSSYAGKQAGAGETGPYARAMIDSVRYELHRLIWKIMTGESPSMIDHENRKKRDNRWNNLRIATRAQNSANATLQRNNTTGLKGVTRHKVNGTYIASIGAKNDKTSYIGSFATPEAAFAAYSEAAKKRWGEFWTPG